jgi:type IV pilus assembly protein PilB
MDIISLLSDKGVLDKSQLAAIKEEIAGGKPVEQALLDRGISAADILAAKGEYYQMPTRAIEDKDTVSYEVLRYIPEESARHYHFIPIGITDGVLGVGTTDPDNLEAVEALNFITAKTNIPYKLYLISDTDFDEVIHMYKGLTGEVGKALNELQTTITDEGSDEPAPAVEGNEEPVLKVVGPVKPLKEDAPVTKIVATILRYAVDGRASDIHIEPTREELKVRFRVDGVLYTSLKLPPNVARAVVARIKVLASLKLDERRKPQDGRFSATVDDRKIDFRVSTFPTYHGEKVVMRILDSGTEKVTMNDLGLTPRNVEMIKRAIARPYGMIVISGPTGSGKSTTLYAMLQEVEREKMNVVSLEDPVEYDVEGVSQSQVRPEIGYTFANGLRSILRQDPDIIMVGEIRDKETAQLAIQAALTGHLVLTTLHTNNAIGIVPRLVDMGIDPYLIAPTLILSVAQRLVRKRCPDAGKAMPVEGSIKAMIDREFDGLSEAAKKDIPKAKQVYGVEPSPTCPNGTRGRIAVFEMLATSKELERVILEKPNEDEIMKVARAQGMFTMKEDAILKMLEGVIPFEEVNTLGNDIVLEPDA